MGSLFGWFDRIVSSRNVDRTKEKRESASTRRVKARTLLLENLEERQLLSVNPLNDGDDFSVLAVSHLANAPTVDLSTIDLQEAPLAASLPTDFDYSFTVGIGGDYTNLAAAITYINNVGNVPADKTVLLQLIDATGYSIAATTISHANVTIESTVSGSAISATGLLTISGNGVKFGDGVSLTSTAGLTISNGGAALFSDGTHSFTTLTNSAGGTLTINTGATLSTTNATALTIAGNVNINGGIFVTTAAVIVTGNVNLDGGRWEYKAGVTVGSTATTTQGTITVENNGWFGNTAGNLAIAIYGMVSVEDSTWSTTGTGAVTVYATGNLTGVPSLDITGTSTIALAALTVNGVLNVSDVTSNFNLRGILTVAGTTTLEDSVINSTSTVAVLASGTLAVDNTVFTSGAITVTAGGAITATGIPSQLNAAVTYNVNSQPTFNAAVALLAFMNQDSTVRAFAITTAASSGSFAYTGDINNDVTLRSTVSLTIGTGSDLTLSAGIYKFSAVTVSASGGALTVNNSTVIVTGTITATGTVTTTNTNITGVALTVVATTGVVTFTNGTQTFSGALSVGANSTLTVDNAIFSVALASATLSGAMVFQNGANVTFGSTATITATGSLTATAATVIFTGAVTVTGTLSATGSTITGSAMTISVTTGSVTFDGGTQTFTGALTLNRNLTLTGTAVTSFGAASTLAATGSISVASTSSLAFTSTLTVGTGSNLNITGFNYISATGGIMFTVGTQADFDNAITQAALQTAYTSATRVQLNIGTDVTLDTAVAPGFTLRRSNVTFNMTTSTAAGRTLTATGTVTIDAAGAIFNRTATTGPWIINAGGDFVVTITAGDTTFTAGTGAVKATNVTINVAAGYTTGLQNAIDLLNHTSTTASTFAITLAGGAYDNFTAKTLNKAGVAVTLSAMAPAIIASGAALTIGHATAASNVANVTVSNVTFNNAVNWYVKDSPAFTSAINSLGSSITTPGIFTIVAQAAVVYGSNLTISRKNVTLTATTTNTMTINGTLTVTADAMTNQTATSFILTAAGVTANSATFEVPDMTSANQAGLNGIVASINTIGIATAGTLTVNFNGVFATGTVFASTALNITQPAVIFNAAAGLMDVPLFRSSGATTTIGSTSTLTLSGVAFYDTALTVNGSLTTDSNLTFTTMTIAAGATLTANNANLTFSGNVSLTAGTNNGTVAVDGGKLIVNGGSFTTTGTATFTVNAGAVATFTGGTQTFIGAITVATSSGTTNVVPAGQLNLTNATTVTAPAVTVNGLMTLTGSTLTASGLVTVGGAGVITLNAPTGPASYALIANSGITVNSGGDLQNGQFVLVTGAVTWNVATDLQFTSALASLANSTDVARFTITSTAAVAYSGNYTISRKNVTLTATTTNTMTFSGKLMVTENALINGNSTNNISFIVTTANTVKVGSAEYTVSDFANFNGTTAAMKIAQFNSISACINGMSGKDVDSGMQTVTFLGDTYDLGSTNWTSLVATTKVTFVGIATGTTVKTTSATAFATTDAIFTRMKIQMAVTCNVTSNESLASALNLANNSPNDISVTGANRTYTINVNKTDLTIADNTTLTRDYVTLKINVADATLNLQGTFTINSTNVSLQGQSSTTTETLAGGTLTVTNSAFPTWTYTNLSTIASSLVLYIPAGNVTHLNTAFTILNTLRPATSPMGTTATFNLAGGTYSRLTALTINRDVTINSIGGVNADISLEGGSVALQTITIAAGATVNLGDNVYFSTSYGHITVHGTLGLSGRARAWTTSGIVTVNGIANISGTARLQSSNNNVIINGTANLTDEGWILTAYHTIVNGTISMSNTARMSATSNGHVTVNSGGTINMSGDSYIYTTTSGNASKVTVKSGGTINLTEDAYISVSGGEVVVEGMLTATGDARINVDTPTTTISTLYIGQVTVNSGGTLSVTGDAMVASESKFSTKGRVLVNSGGLLLGDDVYDNFKIDLAFNCSTTADVMNAFTVGGIARTNLLPDVTNLFINVNGNITLTGAISIQRPKVRFDNTGFTTGYTDGWSWGRLEFAGGITINKNNLATYFADTINVTRKPGTVDVTKPKLEIVGIASLTVNVGDSAAITGAASLVENYGGVVHVPVGLYTKGFEVVGNKPGIIIRGTLDTNSQANSTFIQTVGATTLSIPPYNSSNTTISSPGVHIENIWFDHVPESTASVGPTYNNRFYALGFTSVGGVIDNCKFTSSVTDVNVTKTPSGPLNLNAGTVQNSIFIDNSLWHNAIYYDGDQAIAVINNIFTRTSTTVTTGRAIRVEGNLLHTDDVTALKVTVLIQGNTFNGGWLDNQTDSSAQKTLYTIEYINNDFIKVGSTPVFMTHQENNVVLHGNIFPSDFYFQFQGTSGWTSPWLDATGNYWGIDGMNSTNVYSIYRDVSYWAFTKDRDPVTGNLSNCSDERSGRILGTYTLYVDPDAPGTNRYLRIGNIAYTSGLNLFTTFAAAGTALTVNTHNAALPSTITLAAKGITVANNGTLYGTSTLSKAFPVTISGTTSGSNATVVYGAFIITTQNVTLKDFTLEFPSGASHLTSRPTMIEIWRGNTTISGLTIIDTSPSPQARVAQGINTVSNANLDGLVIENNTFIARYIEMTGIYINYGSISAGASVTIQGNIFMAGPDNVAATGYGIRNGVQIEGRTTASAGMIYILNNQIYDARSGIAMGDNASVGTEARDIKNIMISGNIIGSANNPALYAIIFFHRSDLPTLFGTVDTSSITIQHNVIHGGMTNQFTLPVNDKRYVFNARNNYFGEDNLDAYDIAAKLIGAFDYGNWATETGGVPDYRSWIFSNLSTNPILDKVLVNTADGHYYVPTWVKSPPGTNFADPGVHGFDYDVYYADANVITGNDFYPQFSYVGIIPANVAVLSFLYPQTNYVGDSRFALSADGMQLVTTRTVSYADHVHFTVTNPDGEAIDCEITLHKNNPVGAVGIDFGSYDANRLYAAGEIITTSLVFYGYDAGGNKVLADVISATAVSMGYVLTRNADGVTWTMKTTVARTVTGANLVTFNVVDAETPNITKVISGSYFVRAVDPATIKLNGTAVTSAVAITNSSTVDKVGQFTAVSTSGASASVSWSLAGIDANKFTIDPTTGSITRNAGVGAGLYSVTVVANAASSPANNKSVVAVITVKAQRTPSPTNPIMLVDGIGALLNSMKVYSKGAVVGYVPTFNDVWSDGATAVLTGTGAANFTTAYDTKLKQWVVTASANLTTTATYNLTLSVYLGGTLLEFDYIQIKVRT